MGCSEKDGEVEPESVAADTGIEDAGSEDVELPTGSIPPPEGADTTPKRMTLSGVVSVQTR